MRKTLMALVGASLLALSFAAVAQAQNSATITRDFGCNLFDGNGNLVNVSESKSVVTSSGHETLKCSAKGLPPADDGRAAVQRGFVCNTFLGTTTKTHSTVSASGNSTLTCRVP